jgi:CheY-like chemotaxis protein
MEDDEAVKQLVGRTLTGMGHAVELAPDGQTAVELYQKAKHSDRPFDVVILDLLVHEGMGGRETLQALVKLDPGVQAIAMSGNVLDPVLLEPERHGFQRALTKPFEARELRVILTQVTGRAPGKKIVHE